MTFLPSWPVSRTCPGPEALQVQLGVGLRDRGPSWFWAGSAVLWHPPEPLLWLLALPSESTDHLFPSPGCLCVVRETLGRAP